MPRGSLTSSLLRRGPLPLMDQQRQREACGRGSLQGSFSPSLSTVTAGALSTPAKSQPLGVSFLPASPASTQNSLSSKEMSRL